MAADFKILAITPERPVPDEGSKIAAMLRSGIVDMVHIRHKSLPDAELQSLIEAIPEDLHHRLRLHSHPSLATAFGIAMHCEGGASRSCHELSELSEADRYDYVTLSPIYDSISKAGYKSSHYLGHLRDQLPSGKVIALGGVTPGKFAELQEAGFAGAAMLGYIWQGDLARNLRRIKMAMANRFGLQYITNGTTPEEVASEVGAVLRGGCRWVQIRMKDAPDETLLQAVDLVKDECLRHHAILLIDDRAHLASHDGIDGVHLGKDDMPPAEARKIMGDLKIIGSTANTFDDIAAIAANGATDYIGLGPFRFTTTKKKLSPTLGVDGYRRIFNLMKEHGFDLPVVAIGGLTLADVEPLLHAGASGVAVSGAIRNAPDIPEATSSFLHQIRNHYKHIISK